MIYVNTRGNIKKISLVLENIGGVFILIKINTG